MRAGTTAASAGPWAAPQTRVPGAACDTGAVGRFFNTTGPVVAADHYCIPPLDRLDLREVLDVRPARAARPAERRVRGNLSLRLRERRGRPGHARGCRAGDARDARRARLLGADDAERPLPRRGVARACSRSTATAVTAPGTTRPSTAPPPPAVPRRRLGHVTSRLSLRRYQCHSRVRRCSTTARIDHVDAQLHARIDDLNAHQVIYRRKSASLRASIVDAILGCYPSRANSVSRDRRQA